MANGGGVSKRGTVIVGGRRMVKKVELRREGEGLGFSRKCALKLKLSRFEVVIGK